MVLEMCGDNTHIEWQTLKPDLDMKYSEFYYVALLLNPIFKKEQATMY